MKHRFQHQTDNMNHVSLLIFLCFSLIIFAFISWLFENLFLGTIFLLIQFLVIITLILPRVNVPINSMLFLWIIFFSLYNLSPLINIYLLKSNLAESNIINLGISDYFLDIIILSAVICSSLIFLKFPARGNKPLKISQFIHQNKNYGLLALSFVLLSLLFELINLMRSGGFSIILQGKAIYAERISNLTFTLPTDLTLSFAFSFFGLYFNTEKRKLFLKMLIFAVYAPLLIEYIVLGYRSQIVIHIISFFFARNIGKILNLKFKFILLMLIAYIFLTFIYTIRGILPTAIESNDYSLLFDKFGNEEYTENYNPANNEFGAPFTNYIIFNNDKNSNYLKLGSSYLASGIVAIPQFILPIKKPKDISMEFRDKYFSSLSNKSRISGTGFSPIVEAKWNFGFLGPAVVFLFFLQLIKKIDIHYIFHNTKVTSLLFYFALVPYIAIRFHRSSSSQVVASVIVIGIIVALVRSFKLLKN